MTNSYNNRLRTGLSLAQPTGSWTNGFAYDAAKRLTNVTSPAGSFTYTLGGASAASPLPKKLLLPNTSYITNTFDSVARLTGTYLKNNSHSTLDSALYGYNVGNQRITFTNAAGTYVQYTNDPIGQLKIANSSVNSEDRGYAYDTAWNMHYVTNITTPSTFTVDGKNQLTNAPDGANTYDSNGNMVTAADGYASFEYDDENRLVSVELADYWLEYFYYDGLGRLVGREDYAASGGGWAYQTTTIYVYDGWRVIQERAYPDTPTVSYTRGTDLSGSLEGAGGIGGLLARSHGYSSGNWTNHNFYHADGNGNVTYLVNSSQGLAASYRYDAFGNTISSSGALAAANTYRFSSKMADDVTGMYYYGYRWYAPYWMRWLNRDPLGESGFELLRHRKRKLLGDGPNQYLFVKNNPISRWDALGLVGGGHGAPKGSTDPCPCGEAASQIGAVGPIDANTARRLANEALAAAQASGLPGLHNGQADAFRHCFWSCRMAQEIGAGQAKEVGDIHEKCNKNPAGEEAMDQANNGTGRGFGTPGADCNASCLQAVRDGTLQTSPGGTPPANPY